MRLRLTVERAADDARFEVARWYEVLAGLDDCA